MLRRTLPTLVAVALALGACGASETSTSTALKDCPSSKTVRAVKVTGKFGEAPKLDFDKPLKVTATSCKILIPGKGTKLEAGMMVSFDYVFVNGRDGKEIASSFGQQAGQILFDDTLKTGVAGLYAALNGLAEGSRVLVAMTPADGPLRGKADPSTGVEPDDTLLVVVDLQKVESSPTTDGSTSTTTARNPLPRATGTAVAPVAGLPTVVLATDGTPTITVPKAAPPTELVAQKLIEGDGAVVTSGETITVHYTGVLWDTGEPFDSSWGTGSPASFQIGTGAVIPGWDKGLVGQKVGSQVLLVVPPADGYPDGQGSIPAGATLVFVVDILDAYP